MKLQEEGITITSPLYLIILYIQIEAATGTSLKFLGILKHVN